MGHIGCAIADRVSGIDLSQLQDRRFQFHHRLERSVGIEVRSCAIKPDAGPGHVKLIAFAQQDAARIGQTQSGFGQGVGQGGEAFELTQILRGRGVFGAGQMAHDHGDVEILKGVQKAADIAGAVAKPRHSGVDMDGAGPGRGGAELGGFPGLVQDGAQPMLDVKRTVLGAIPRKHPDIGQGIAQCFTHCGAFLDGRHKEGPSALLGQAAGDGARAEPIGVRLDHGAGFRLRRQGLQRCVVARDRVQVDDQTGPRVVYGRGRENRHMRFYVAVLAPCCKR